MRQRLDYIDSLRGVAIIGVVATHCAQHIHELSRTVSDVAGYGARGVQLFFVLSALTLASVTSNVSVRAFYVRRFFRIAPMFYTAAGFYLVWNGVGPNYFAPDGIGVRQIVQTLTFTHGFTPDAYNSVVPGGWSIAVEALFYVIFPLLFATITTLRRALFAVGMCLGLMITTKVAGSWLMSGYTPQYLANGFIQGSLPFNLYAFSLGFLALHCVRQLEAKPLRNGRIIGMAMVTLSTAALFGSAIAPPGPFTNYVVSDTLFFILVISVYLAGVSQRGLGAVFRHIGVVSFSIYLVHFAVIDIVAAHWKTGLSPALDLLAMFAVVLAAATAISTFTYYQIERRMINLGARIARVV